MRLCPTHSPLFHTGDKIWTETCMGLRLTENIQLVASFLPGDEAIQLAPLHIPHKYSIPITAILISTETYTYRQTLQLCLHIFWQHVWGFVTFQLWPPALQGVMQCPQSVQQVAHLVQRSTQLGNVVTHRQLCGEKRTIFRGRPVTGLTCTLSPCSVNNYSGAVTRLTCTLSPCSVNNYSGAVTGLTCTLSPCSVNNYYALMLTQLSNKSWPSSNTWHLFRI